MNSLHKLFVRVHSRYSRSPHAEDLAGFAHWLMEHEYYVRHAKALVFRTMRSLVASRFPPGHIWTSEELEQAFYRVRQRALYRYACHTFGTFLKSIGRMKPLRETGPHASVIRAYERYLSEVRGLGPDTISLHLAEVRALLRSALSGGQRLKQLTSANIEDYIEHQARSVSRHTLSARVCCLRAFLRYSFDHRLITTRLDIFDRPVSCSAEQPPRALDWLLIQRFLRSIDRTDKCGWRDFMMLHLMAHYGLRPGEVARLTVDSIDWKAGILRVEQPKTHTWLTLPLIDQTLTLLRCYLHEWRRQSHHRELFLSSVAPRRPMKKAAVSQMFKMRARKSGLPIAHASTYALRHSFAMRLFARGVGIKAIGDLMGHSSLASTAVYLRLQSDVLREVALPVPTRREHVGGAA